MHVYSHIYAYVHTGTHVHAHTFKELDKNSLDFGVGKSGGSRELEWVIYGETINVCFFFALSN